jgi:hypothetical protein
MTDSTSTLHHAFYGHEPVPSFGRGLRPEHAMVGDASVTVDGKLCGRSLTSLIVEHIKDVNHRLGRTPPFHRDSLP